MDRHIRTSHSQQREKSKRQSFPNALQTTEQEEFSMYHPPLRKRRRQHNDFDIDLVSRLTPESQVNEEEDTSNTSDQVSNDAQNILPTIINDGHHELGAEISAVTEGDDFDNGFDNYEPDFDDQANYSDSQQDQLPVAEIALEAQPNQPVQSEDNIAIEANTDGISVVQTLPMEETRGPVEEQRQEQPILEDASQPTDLPSITIRSLLQMYRLEDGSIDMTALHVMLARVDLSTNELTFSDLLFDLDAVMFHTTAMGASKLGFDDGPCMFRHSRKQISKRTEYVANINGDKKMVKDIKHTHILRYYSWIGVFEVYMLHPEMTPDQAREKVELAMIESFNKQKHPGSLPKPLYMKTDMEYAPDVVMKALELLGDNMLFFCVYGNKNRQSNRGLDDVKLSQLFTKLNNFYNGIVATEDWGTRISAVDNQGQEIPRIITPTKSFVTTFCRQSHLKSPSIYEKLSLDIVGFESKATNDTQAVLKLKGYVDGIEDCVTQAGDKLLQSSARNHVVSSFKTNYLNSKFPRDKRIWLLRE